MLQLPKAAATSNSHDSVVDHVLAVDINDHVMCSLVFECAMHSSPTTATNHKCQHHAILHVAVAQTPAAQCHALSSLIAIR